MYRFTSCNPKVWKTNLGDILYGIQIPCHQRFYFNKTHSKQMFWQTKTLGQVAFIGVEARDPFFDSSFLILS